MDIAKRMIVAAATVVVTGGICGTAQADLVDVEFEILQGDTDNFYYSLLHETTNSNGTGSPLYRLAGSFSAQVDLDANSIQFTGFDGALYDDISLGDPGFYGDLIGDVSLSQGFLEWDETTKVLGGDIDLMMDFGDGPTLMSFHFEQQQYTSIANSFEPATMSLALWGATPNVFGDEWDGASMGMDLVGAGTVVPTPAAFAVFGIAGVGLIGRRRH